MDDIMKSLDADTSVKCFRALLGKDGLLRQDGITVIMATHNGKEPKHHKASTQGICMS